MQPAYGGDLGRIVSKGGRVDIPEDFKEYVLMLKDWDDDCKEQLSRMTAKNFLDAFEAVSAILALICPGLFSQDTG